MKSVLISIQPKWCELIASGKKTVEVRKTKPKLETPFKCYIYCTIDGGVKGDMLVRSKLICGKVIGEFVCDWVVGTCPWRLKGKTGFCAKRTEKETNLPNMACLTLEEIEQYAGHEGRGIYGWHISDLVIYDKPRELSEFRTPCKMGERLCGLCDYAVHGMDGDLIDCNTSLTRPPQSWCYVESEDTE